MRCRGCSQRWAALANALVAVLGPELTLGSPAYCSCRALIREMQVGAWVLCSHRDVHTSYSVSSGSGRLPGKRPGGCPGARALIREMQAVHTHT